MELNKLVEHLKTIQNSIQAIHEMVRHRFIEDTMMEYLYAMNNLSDEDLLDITDPRGKGTFAVIPGAEQYPRSGFKYQIMKAMYDRVMQRLPPYKEEYHEIPEQVQTHIQNVFGRVFESRGGRKPRSSKKKTGKNAK